MKRDEVLAKLRGTRAKFDCYLGEIPAGRLAEKAPGTPHSPKDIIYHVAAYDDLIVRRLRSARGHETTAFDRDREGWEAFNERIWAEASELDTATIIMRAAATFLDLLDEIRQLTDEDLEATSVPTQLTAYLDQGWLQGRALWELIGIDGFEHYPMHYAHLSALADQDRS